MSRRVLFVFTKQFPYGNMEQYLAEEIKHLPAFFTEIIYVPCELFGSAELNRELPAGFKILDINKEATGTGKRKHYAAQVKILFDEFLHERYKRRFISEFIRYRAILSYQFLLADFFSQYLKEYREAEIYLYAYWLHNSAVMLGLLKREGVIRNFVARAHSIDLYHNDWPFAFGHGTRVLPFQYFKMKMTSAVFSVSDKGKKYLEDKFPQMRERIFTSFLGVEDRGTGHYDSGDPFTLVSCSHVVEIKRVPFIAEIFSRLPFPARWIHFGDGREMPVVKEITARLPAHLTAELRGHTPNHEILDFYRKNTVNLFINMSTVEGIPVSLMEAISFGIPIMAPAVFGIPEIANERSGFLVPPDPVPEECAAIIRRFHDNRELQGKKRKSAREFYLEKFDSTKNFSRFFQEILAYRAN